MVVGLSACRVDFVVETTVGRDGDGVLTVGIEGDEEVFDALVAADLGDIAALFGASQMTELDAQPALFTDLESSGWTIERSTGATTLAYTFEDPSQLGELTSALVGGAAPGTILPAMTLKADVGLWRSHLELRASADMSLDAIVSLVGTGLESPPTIDELDRVVGGSFADVFSVDVVIVMPGSPTVEATTEPTTEPTSPSAGTFVWHLVPGESLNATVETDVWRIGNVVLTAVIAAALFGAIVVAVALVKTFRHHD